MLNVGTGLMIRLAGDFGKHLAKHVEQHRHNVDVYDSTGASIMAANHVEKCSEYTWHGSMFPQQIPKVSNLWHPTTCIKECVVGLYAAEDITPQTYVTDTNDHHLQI